MIKKLKDLTDEEMYLICKKYYDCHREAGKVNCPLAYANTCLKGEIQKNRYLQKEVSLDGFVSMSTCKECINYSDSNRCCITWRGTKPCEGDDEACKDFMRNPFRGK